MTSPLSEGSEPLALSRSRKYNMCAAVSILLLIKLLFIECGKKNELVVGAEFDKQEIKCKNCTGRIFYKVR